MTLTQRMYEGAKDIWPCYLEHPFVVGMAEGTLPLEKFRCYMLQDYAYLRDYIKIFAAILLKADDFGDIRFLCENMMAVIDETERVHVPYMKRLGITEEEIAAVVPHITNSSYTHYMICEAQSGSALAGLVALLNCSWTYAYIGEEMGRRYPNAVNHPDYGQWFAGYDCEEYRQTNQGLIDMVDQLGQEISQKEADKLCQIFRQCSLYELKFWDMAYADEK